jgi:hypothetical protein
MEFNDFTNKIIEAVKEELGEDYQVSVHSVEKNNGVALTGLAALKRGINICPMVYLEPFYYAISEDRKNFEQVLADILGKYAECMIDKPVDISYFTEYGKIKEKIRTHLVNTEMNKDLLATIPHREYMDLSMIYRVSFDRGDGVYGNITISLKHMRLWGVTEQELFEQARSNMEATDDMEIRGISEVFREAVGDETAEEIGVLERNAIPLYVVTNKERLYGAVAMLNQKIMKKAAEIINKDFMILPSSVHEILVLPATDEAEEINQLACMVKEVNTAEVRDDEILSSHVYRYNHKTGEIAIAA